MAVGYESGGSLGLVHSGAVTHLDEVTSYADLDIRLAEPFPYGAAVTGVMDVIDQAVDGYRVRLWDDLYFGIIHVIPRKKDVGSIVTEVRFQVEVWNADEIAHIGESVGVTGSSGVTIENGPTLPAAWPPFSSLFTDVVVDEEGDPIVDALVTWVFPGFTGTDCQVVGIRLDMYGLSPSWDAGVEESYGWLSDVIQGRDGVEQRIQLRGYPERHMSFEAHALDARETAEMAIKLFNTGRLVWAVPYWPDGAALAAPVTALDTTIWADTTSRFFEVGGLCTLWRDHRTWEVFTIQSVNPDSLVVTSGAINSWAQNGTYVLPVLKCRLTEAATLDRPSSHVATIRTNFLSER